MERMGVEYQRFDGKEYVSLKRYYNLLCKCKALEKENKNLKESLDIATKCSSKEEDGIIRLSEENRNLKNELMEDMKTESKLNEEIRNLKSELSKFRDSFKKYRDYEKEELAESCYDLARENEKLKEERDFFKEQAMLWRKDYTNEYEKNRNLIGKLESLEK